MHGTDSIFLVFVYGTIIWQGYGKNLERYAQGTSLVATSRTGTKYTGDGWEKKKKKKRLKIKAEKRYIGLYIILLSRLGKQLLSGWLVRASDVWKAKESDSTSPPWWTFYCDSPVKRCFFWATIFYLVSTYVSRLEQYGKARRGRNEEQQY